MDNSEELVKGAEVTLAALEKIDLIKQEAELAKWRQKVNRQIVWLVGVNAISSLMLCLLLWAALAHLLFLGMLDDNLILIGCYTAIPLALTSLYTMLILKRFN